MSKNKQNPTLSTLVKAGLARDEAEIYLDLLEHGAESASDIAKHTSVKRTYVYHLTEDLISKGLITKRKEGRTTVFEPNSPDHLLGIVEEKKAELTSAERELEAVMSSLKDKYSSVEAKPVVTVFEGLEGLKKVFNDTLSEKNKIYALVEASEVIPELRDWLETDYVKRRIERDIYANVILASGNYAKKYVSKSKELLRTVREVPKSEYPISMEVNIYGNKVAFMNYKKDEEPVAFILEHPIVAKTLKAWFDLAWEKAKK